MKKIISGIFGVLIFLNLFISCDSNNVVFYKSCYLGNCEKVREILMKNSGIINSELTEKEVTTFAKFCYKEEGEDDDFDSYVESFEPNYIRDAVKSGSVETVNLLLEYNANSNSVLFWASVYDAADMFKSAVAHNADINTSTGLHYAAKLGNEDIIDEFINVNVNLNTVYDEATPLVHALLNSNESIAIKLINSGADISIPSNNGTTPLSIASNNNMKKAVAVLIDNHADINQKRDDGVTALYFALVKNNHGIAKYLLDNGAEITPKIKTLLKSDDKLMAQYLPYNMNVYFCPKWPAYKEQYSYKLGDLSNPINYVYADDVKRYLIRKDNGYSLIVKSGESDSYEFYFKDYNGDVELYHMTAYTADKGYNKVSISGYEQEMNSWYPDYEFRIGLMLVSTMYNSVIEAMYDMNSVPKYTRELKVTEPLLKGKDVTKVQNLLLTKGLLDLEKADGIYGSETEYAVKRYQKYMGMNQTGIVDSELYKILFANNDDFYKN